MKVRTWIQGDLGTRVEPQSSGVPNHEIIVHTFVEDSTVVRMAEPKVDPKDWKQCTLGEIREMIQRRDAAAMLERDAELKP